MCNGNAPNARLLVVISLQAWREAGCLLCLGREEGKVGLEGQRVGLVPRTEYTSGDSPGGWLVL